MQTTKNDMRRVEQCITLWREKQHHLENRIDSIIQTTDIYDKIHILLLLKKELDEIKITIKGLQQEIHE